MANTTNFNWETPDDTDLVKDGAAAIRTLGSAIDTSLVDLKGGTTGQVLSKATNTDMDFTWVAQDDSNAIQNALLTTTGDTIYASAASTPARLGIGSSGQSLTVVAGVPSWAASATSVLTTTGDILYASSANTLARRAIGSTGNVLTVSGGVPTWAAPSSGSMTLLSTTSLSGSQIDLSSISQSYQNLVLIIKDVRVVSNGNRLRVRLNGVSSTTYFNYTTFGVFEPIAPNDNVLYAGAGLSSGTDNDSLFKIEFPNYANTDTRKMMICTAITASASAPTTDNGGSFNWGANRSTSAITEINLLTNGSGFTSGTALLYGVN